MNVTGYDYSVRGLYELNVKKAEALCSVWSNLKTYTG